MATRLVFVTRAMCVLAGSLAAACGADGDVGPGGTCFLVTDCSQAQGLFCLRPDGSDNGTCVGKSDLSAVQPAGDATLADTAPARASDAAPGKTDAAPAPASDAAPGETDDSSLGSDSPASAPDAPTSDHSSSAVDTGTLDGGAPDTAPDDSGSTTNG